MWQEQHESLSCAGNGDIQQPRGLLEGLSLSPEEVLSAVHMDGRISLSALRLVIGLQFDPALLLVIEVH